MPNSWYNQNITNKQDEYCVHSDVQFAKNCTYQYKYSSVASYNPYNFDDKFTRTARQESFKRFSEAALDYVALGEKDNPEIGKLLKPNGRGGQSLSAEPSARERTALQIQDRLDQLVGPPGAYLGIRKHVLSQVNSLIEDRPEYLKWRQSPHDDLKLRATEWGRVLAYKLNKPVGNVSLKYLMARETGALKTASRPMYQGRMNEEDIYHLAKDVKQFQSHLYNDIGRGTIRNTGQHHDPQNGVEIITAKQALLKLREVNEASKTLQETKPVDRWEQILETGSKKSTEQVKAPMTYLQALMSEPAQEPAVAQGTTARSSTKDSKSTLDSQPETQTKTQVVLDWPKRQHSPSELQQSNTVQNLSSAQQAKIASDLQIQTLDSRSSERERQTQTRAL